jgi:galactoside O-acetyltransferase
MTFCERLILQGEECWRFLFGWIPGGPGTLLRRYAYAPLFAGRAAYRTGVGVVVQGFRHITLGRHVGLNRHVSLYAARGRISMGDNVYIGDFSSINANDAEIRIGGNVAVGPFCVIQGANHAFDRLDIPVVQQGHVPSRVVIEDNVWIGAHAVILPGVRVETGAVIAAGAVVSRDIPANAVAAGVPARVIRLRGENSASFAP